MHRTSRVVVESNLAMEVAGVSIGEEEEDIGISGNGGCQQQRLRWGCFEPDLKDNDYSGSAHRQWW